MSCDPSRTPCDPAKIAVNFAGKTVTFTGLVLIDGATASSTLTGTLVW